MFWSSRKKVQDSSNSTKDWLPVKEITNGILLLKSGEYLRILEVSPINFKLRSKAEKKSIIINYMEFLKACRFPVQILVQCKKSDIEPHINKMEEFCKNETNENTKNMLHGYVNLVKSLGAKGAISRRFFMEVPYVPPLEVKNIDFNEVTMQLDEKTALIKEYLKVCGNIVMDTDIHTENGSILNILYTFLNKRTSEVQKFGLKIHSLSGMVSDLKEDDL